MRMIEGSRSARTYALVSGMLVVLVIAACNRDLESPGTRTVRPAGAHRTVSYPHANNGPCYVWGADNPQSNYPGKLYVIGQWGINPVDTTCGVPMWFEARNNDVGYTYNDSLYVWYYITHDIGDTSIAGSTIWKTGPHTIGAWGATGLAALVAHFGKPLKAATVRFRCPIETGFQLQALSTDLGILATKTVPTIPSCTFTTGYSDVTVTVANPPYISILVASGPPHPAQPDTALDYDGGVEYWIVPDSSSRLQITVSGSPDGTSAFVGDTMKYLASATDGSAITISSWKWVADPGTSPPPGMTEKLSVTACNPNGKKPNPCLHTPLTSGTIKVYGTINKKSDSATRHINVTLPKITLVCGPLTGGDPSKGIAPSPAPGVSVTRGDSVTCSARAYFRNPSLSGWTFTADDQAVGTVRGNTGSTGYDWAGPAVTSGSVAVQGTVNGVNAISDTGKILVKPRVTGFRFQIDTSRAADGATDMQCFATRLWSPPDSAVAWTAVPNCVSPPLSPSPFRTDTVNTAAKRVRDGGPNGGLWYLDSLGPTKVLLRSTVLKDLRSDADAYPVDIGDLVQSACSTAGQGSPLTPLVVDSVCEKNTGPTGGAAYRLHLYRHEGCHMAVHSSYVNDSTAGIRGALEALVRPDSVTSAGDARIFLQVIENLSRNRSRGVDTLPPSTFSLWGPISPAGGWNYRDATVPGFYLPPLCP